MILKKNLCNYVPLCGLFFFFSFSFSSYRDFRDKAHLEIVTSSPARKKSPAIDLCKQMSQAISLHNEHALKIALYNNHHQELRRLVTHENVNMKLSPDAQTNDDETMLSFACRIKGKGCCKEFPDEVTIGILLENSADPLCANSNGPTPCTIVQSQGHEKPFIYFGQCLKKSRADAVNTPAPGLRRTIKL